MKNDVTLTEETGVLTEVIRIIEEMIRAVASSVMTETTTEVTLIIEEMIETVNSNVMTETTATVATGNVRNVEIQISHSDKNATDVESLEETPTVEVTTEVASITEEMIGAVASNVMTAAVEKFSMITTGNAHSVRIPTLPSEQNVTDVEHLAAGVIPVEKEEIQTEDNHKEIRVIDLHVETPNAHLVERGNAHLVETGETEEMNVDTAIKTTTTGLVMMNSPLHENLESLEHLENHVEMDLAMPIIVRQNH